MNKKIIGIGVAMLFAASGASAQTSVTLYGTVDAGGSYINGQQAAGRTVNLQSGQQTYSHIGFRGTEDLGRGMKALFALEQGVLIDTGSSGLRNETSNLPFDDAGSTFSSQAYVGVSSNYAGTVKLGRQFSPLYEAHDVIDPFKSGFAADINNFFGTDEFGFSNYQRMSNAITYHTPDNLFGFKGALAYGFGEVAGSMASQSQAGVSLGYMNGPLAVVYAYHQANNDQNIILDGTFKTHFVGATFDFGMAKLHAAFDQNKRVDTFKTQDYMIGVTVPFGGMHSLFADYTHKKDKVLNDANASQIAVGYTYDFSKRTNLYTAYTHVRNDNNSFINTEVAGNRVNVFQIGMRHMF